MQSDFLQGNSSRNFRDVGFGRIILNFPSMASLSWDVKIIIYQHGFNMLQEHNNRGKICFEVIAVCFYLLMSHYNSDIYIKCLVSYFKHHDMKLWMLEWWNEAPGLTPIWTKSSISAKELCWEVTKEMKALKTADDGNLK